MLTYVGMPEVRSGLYGLEGVPKSVVRQDGALGHVWHSVHVRGVFLVLSVPVDGGSLAAQHVRHVGDDDVALAYLAEKTSLKNDSEKNGNKQARLASLRDNDVERGLIYKMVSPRVSSSVTVQLFHVGRFCKRDGR